MSLVTFHITLFVGLTLQMIFVSDDCLSSWFTYLRCKYCINERVCVLRLFLCKYRRNICVSESLANIYLIYNLNLLFIKFTFLVWVSSFSSPIVWKTFCQESYEGVNIICINFIEKNWIRAIICPLLVIVFAGAWHGTFGLCTLGVAPPEFAIEAYNKLLQWDM